LIQVRNQVWDKVERQVWREVNHKVEIQVRGEGRSKARTEP
jgi:hypothetical protein